MGASTKPSHLETLDRQVIVVSQPTVYNDGADDPHSDRGPRADAR